MRYASVCSGIEAPSVAWEPLGWEPVFFSEIEAFPNAVLAHHYPEVPNLGDMTTFTEWPDYAIDVIVGGTPCQSFSVAGLRGGLDDARGNLMLVYCEVIERYKPKWVIWENVPGCLSSNGGRDFGTFLGALAKLGYGFAYRVLDAQCFGVAQRRRRVFVVACAGGQWQRAAAVLFERESLCRNPKTSETTREEVASTIRRRIDGHRGDGNDAIVPVANSLVSRSGCPQIEDTYIPVARCLTSHNERLDSETENFVVTVQGGFAEQNGAGCPTGPCYTLNTVDRHSVCQVQCASGGGKIENDTAQALRARAEHNYQFVRDCPSVRRLTPRECERLQGFPDDYTAITYRNQPACDGPRYKALGNSMAVPVIRWLGERIRMVDNIVAQETQAEEVRE